LGKLRIYTDENVDVHVAEGLRRRGVVAFSALEKKMIGASDLEHFIFAAHMRAAIFTHDHHFIEIAEKSALAGKDHWGVIFIEMNRLSLGECVKRLALYADLLSVEEMQNRIEFL